MAVAIAGDRYLAFFESTGDNTWWVLLQIGNVPSFYMSQDSVAESGTYTGSF